MATLPSLLAFGSLTPLPSRELILQLQETFRQKSSLLRPLVEAISDLDLIWTKLAEQHSSFNTIDGGAAIRSLQGILSGTVANDIRDEKRNIVIVPITVLTHIVLYLNFIEHSGVADHKSVLENVAAGGGVQGLCVGLLSAQAVSSATTVEDIVALSCTSLRLAFCIGACVDADQISSEGDVKSATFAIRWKAPTTLEDVQKLLQSYPNVRVSMP
jgi:hypothetical protein